MQLHFRPAYRVESVEELIQNGVLYLRVKICLTRNGKSSIVIELNCQACISTGGPYVLPPLT
jgi:hypothetical protein